MGISSGSPPPCPPRRTAARGGDAAPRAAWCCGRRRSQGGLRRALAQHAAMFPRAAAADCGPASERKPILPMLGLTHLPSDGVLRSPHLLAVAHGPRKVALIAGLAV